SAERGLRAPGRRFVKLAEHVPDMLRYRRHARGADLAHYQWLAVEPLDLALLPPKRPRVLTAHNVLFHEPRPGQAAVRRRILRAMDAVVVHSQHGAEGAARLGADPSRVRVIPHGAFDYLTRQPSETPLPDALAAAISELLTDDAARAQLADAATRAAAGPYSWDAIAERTLALYRELGA